MKVVTPRSLVPTAWQTTSLAWLGSLTLASAQALFVPNHSFESQLAPNSPPYVNVFVDNWQKIAEPAYFDPIFGGFGIPWFGTAGVFLDINPYVNRIGAQAGYILAFPQVTLFQDFSTSPSFTATYEVGKSYDLTLGVFGKSTLAPGSTLLMSLFYRDDANNKVTVGSTTITYSAAAFPTSGPLALVDYSVTIPTVQATDAWAGKHIGIQLESTTPLELTTGGNWDFDNVRLTAVPEPTSAALLGLGAMTWLARRARRGPQH